MSAMNFRKPSQMRDRHNKSSSQEFIRDAEHSSSLMTAQTRSALQSKQQIEEVRKLSTVRHQTPQIFRAMGRQDPIEDKRKLKGFQVFVDAFQNFCDDGFSGQELQQKALSQYTNWAAQEWDKPHEFSTDQMPFVKSTLQKGVGSPRRQKGSRSQLQSFRIKKRDGLRLTSQQRKKKQQEARDMQKLEALGHEFDMSSLDRRLQRIHMRTDLMNNQEIEQELAVASGPSLPRGGTRTMDHSRLQSGQMSPSRGQESPFSRFEQGMVYSSQNFLDSKMLISESFTPMNVTMPGNNDYEVGKEIIINSKGDLASRSRGMTSEGVVTGGRPHAHTNPSSDAPGYDNLPQLSIMDFPRQNKKSVDDKMREDRDMGRVDIKLKLKPSRSAFEDDRGEEQIVVKIGSGSPTTNQKAFSQPLEPNSDNAQPALRRQKSLRGGPNSSGNNSSILESIDSQDEGSKVQQETKQTANSAQDKRSVSVKNLPKSNEGNSINIVAEQLQEKLEGLTAKDFTESFRPDSTTQQQNALEYNDFVVTLTPEQQASLRDAYELNVAFSKHLATKVGNLKRFEQNKRKRLMQAQVERLMVIRNNSSYKKDIKNLIKTLNYNKVSDIQRENQKDVSNSFKKALFLKWENQAYMHRLRLREVHVVLDYKEQLRRGKIPDFKSTFDVLGKIVWFNQYNFSERQALVKQARIKIFEPDERIFTQGEESPCIHIILYGSVRATMSKAEWGPSVILRLSTFFDGQVFGEMSDYEAQKDQISTRMLKELQMQKYSAFAQERSCILSIRKSELNELSGNKKQIMMQERLTFIKEIDIFQGVSLFSLLPITNKLISKKFKLGQQILRAGTVPQGLFIIKSGYCKVGVIKLQPYEIKGKEEAWCRPREKPMRYADQMLDPIPDSKMGMKDYQVAEKLNLQIDTADKQSVEYVQAVSRYEKQVKDKLYTKEKYLERMRTFQDKYVCVDENNEPLEDNQTKLRKFLTFYKLGPMNYFGGRVLIAESSITTEGKEKSASGVEQILPSQLNVVADSAEVEVLIFDKAEIAFFPEDVQREIIIGLRKTQNVERPYTDAEMEVAQNEFGKWDAEKQEIMVRGLKKMIPMPMQLENYSFTNQDKPMMIKLTKNHLI